MYLYLNNHFNLLLKFLPDSPIHPLILDKLFILNCLVNIILFPYFIFAAFISFYIPGNIILGETKKEFTSWFEKITVSLVLGFVFWAYQGIIFGYLHLRFLTYFYLAIFFVIWVKKNYYYFKTKKNKYAIKFSAVKANLRLYILVLIFLIGIFGQTQKFWVSGSVGLKGLYIFTSSSDDALWHTALISQLVRRFPPFEPGLVNVNVHNYYYWSDLIIAELIRVFNLPFLGVQFLYMYVLFSFLLGGVAYTLAKRLNFSFYGIIIFVYLQYFSSDLIYILILITRHTIDFTGGPIEGGVEFLENLPRAVSIIVAYCAIIFLSSWLKNKTAKKGILIALLVGSLVGLKIYTAIVFIAGILILQFYMLFKRDYKLIPIIFLTTVISLGIYLPVNASAGGLILTPFWMTRNFSVQPNLKLSNFELAREIYYSHKNFIQAFRMDITMFIIFLLAQLGIKNIGFIFIKNSIRKFEVSLIIFFYSSIAIGIILGTFFYQKIGGGNIFNFYLASSLFLTVPASFILGELLNKKRLINVFIILLILLTTIPRWVYRSQSFLDYFKTTSPTISLNELKAMDFIQKNTGKDEVILVFNKGYWDSLYPYVSAFTKRDMYVSGQGILNSHGVEKYKEREFIRDLILTSNDSNLVKKLLIKNNIKLLYFYGNPDLKAGLKNLALKRIYQNDSVTIFHF